MTKQEYMAISLPFGLKAIYTPFDEPDSVVEFGSSRYSMMLNKEYNYKPILRPISDLIVEIDHNMEVFVPLYKLVDPENTEWSKLAAIEYNPFPKIPNYSPYYKVHHDTLGEVISVNPRNILVLPFHLVCKLVEWHFDICGLIEKGEAIDVNTLEINPYK